MISLFPYDTSLYNGWNEVYEIERVKCDFNEYMISNNTSDLFLFSLFTITFNYNETLTRLKAIALINNITENPLT